MSAEYVAAWTIRGALMGAEKVPENSLTNDVVSRVFGIKTNVYTVEDPGNHEKVEFSLSGAGRVVLHTGSELYFFNTVDILRVAQQLATDYEKEYEGK